MARVDRIGLSTVPLEIEGVGTRVCPSYKLGNGQDQESEFETLAFRENYKWSL